MRGWGTGDEEGEISFGVKGFFFVGKPDGKFCTIWLLSSFFEKGTQLLWKNKGESEKIFDRRFFGICQLIFWISRHRK